MVKAGILALYSGITMLLKRIPGLTGNLGKLLQGPDTAVAVAQGRPRRVSG